MINFFKNLLIVIAFIEAGLLIGLSVHISGLYEEIRELRCDRLTLWNLLMNFLKSNINKQKSEISKEGE